MRKLSYFVPMLFLPVLWITACSDDLNIDNSRNTYADDICDITYVNGHFFSTNYDLSGHAGSQIDLLQFSADTGSVYLTDRFDLEMNGQGYFGMTTDGQNLFLQSMDTWNLLGVSPVGERIYLTADTVNDNWRPSGIAYLDDLDSLAVLYRNFQQTDQYRLRVLSKTIDQTASRDTVFELTNVDTDYYGIYSMAYHNSEFYLLGVDLNGQDVLLTSGWNFAPTQVYPLADSTVVGLCFKYNDLYLSYRNRRIEEFQLR